MTRKFGTAVLALVVTLVLGLSRPSLVHSQEANDEGIRYRRGFVHENDLPALGLEGYVPVDITELENLLSKAARSAGENEANAVLKSAVLSASLVGEDLVSELSRIETRNTSGKARIDLTPMSIAIKPLTRPSGKPDAVVPEAESHFLPNGTIQLVADRSAYFWFAWSSHGIFRPNTHSIHFDFEIPACIESVLLLRLPPSWRVESTSHVVRSVSDTESVFPTDWPKSTMPSNPNEGLWAVTLGGRSRCVLQLKRDQRSVNVRYPVVVDSCNSKYAIESQGVALRSSMTFDIATDRTDPLRLVLSPISRVRKVEWNGQPLSWASLSESIIQVQMPTELNEPPRETDATSTPNVDTLDVDSFTPFSETAFADQKPYGITLPSIQTEGGFAITGKHVVVVDPMFQLSDIRSSQGIVSNGSDSVTASWSIDWNRIQPEIDIVLQSNRFQPNAECLTIVTPDAAQIATSSFIRLEKAEKFPSPFHLQLPPNWILDSISSSESNISLTSQLTGTDEAPRVAVEWSSTQPGTPLIFEVRLHQNRQGDIDNISLDRWPNVEIEEADQQDTIVVETSDQYKLLAAPPLLRAKISDRQLKPWQSSRLPRTGALWILALEDHIVPDMQFSLQPNNFTAFTNTNLRAVGDSLECLYRVRCIPEAGKIERVQVDFDGPGSGEIQWSQLIENKYVPVSATFLSGDGATDVSGWSLKPKEPTSQPLEFIGMRRTSLGQPISNPPTSNPPSSKSPSPNSWQRIALPNASQATSQVASVSIDGSLQAHYPTDQVRPSLRAEGSWDKIEFGEHFEFDPARSNLLEVRHFEKDRKVKWIPEQSVNYFLLPSGVLAANSQWRVLENRTAEFSIDIPDKWKLVSVRVNQETAAVFASPGHDHRVTVVLPSETLGQRDTWIDAQFECQRFIQPPSELELQRPTSPSPVAVLHRQIWLPKGLSIQHRRTTSFDRLLRWAKIWNWYRSLLMHESNEVRTESTFNSPLCSQPLQSYALDSTVNDAQPRLTTASLATGQSSVIQDPAFPSQRIELHYEGRAFAVRWIVFLTVVGVVLAYRKHRLLMICTIPIVSALIVMVLDEQYFLLLQAACLGALLGSFVSLADWLFAARRDKDSPSTMQASKHSEPRHGSNIPGSNMPGSSIHTRAILIFVLMFSGNQSFAQISVMPPTMPPATDSPIQTASPSANAASSSLPSFDVIIPMDAEGNLSGNVAYVPEAILDHFFGKSNNVRQGVGFEILSARYQAVFSGSTFDVMPLTLNMNYEMEVLDDGAPVVFPLVASQAKLIRFLVDDREISPGSRLILNDGRLSWLPDRTGRIRIRIDVLPQIRMQENGIPIVQVSVLNVATAQLEAQTDRIGWLKVAARGQVLNPQVGRYLAQLGPVDAIELSWQPKDRSAVDRKQSEVQIDTWLNTDSDQPMALTNLLVSNVRSETDSIEVECSSEWQPLGLLWGQAKVVETVTGTTLTRRRYRLNWDESQFDATANSHPITTLWIPENPSSTTMGIPSVEVIGMRTLSRVLAYTQDDGPNWEIQGIGVWPNAEKVNEPKRLFLGKTGSDFQVRRIPENSILPILRKIKTEQKSQVRLQTELSFQPTFIEANVSGLLTGISGNDHSIRFQLPAGGQAIQVQVNEQSAPFAMMPSSNDQSHLIVYKPAAAITPDNFRMKVRWPLLLNESKKIPFIKPLGMNIIESRLSASRAIELGIEFEGIETSIQSDGAFLSKLNVPLWDFVQPQMPLPSTTGSSDSSQVYESPVELQATYLARPYANTLTGLATTKLSRPEATWLVEFDANLVGQQQVDSLLIEMPTSLLPTLESDCPRFVFAIPNQNRVILNLRPKKAGANGITLRLTAELPVTGTETVATPIFRILQNSQIQNRFLVPESIGNQKANWKTTGVRVVDRNELDDIGLDPLQNLVFAATSANPQIRLASLESTRQEDQRAIVNHVLTLASNGTLIQSRYWLFAPDVTSLRVRMPSRFTTLAITVNGQSVQFPNSNSGVMEIPVITSDLPFAMELTGVQPQNEIVTGSTALMLPILENVEIDKTFWRVEQTSPMQSLLFEGNWVPQTLSYKQWTSALTGELLGVLERGTRLLVDRSPADRQAWFSIWDQVVGLLLAQGMLDPIPPEIPKGAMATYLKEWSDLANRLGITRMPPESSSRLVDQADHLTIAFGASPGQQPFINVQPVRIPESRVWFSVTAFIVAFGVVLFAVNRYKAGLRTFVIGHPWWLLFAIAIGFAILLPWRWIGGFVALLSFWSALQAFVSQRQRARRSRNLTPAANWQKSSA